MMEKNPSFYINLSMHVAGSVERTLRNDTLQIQPEDQQRFEADASRSLLDPALAYLDETLKITFSVGELFYTYELIQNARQV